MQNYDEFVEKFKPKKTTDDCYTPPLVYDAVLSWAKQHLNIVGRPVVRPFYPGGDYENYLYPEGCVVVDNPPFSIFAKIVDFYASRGIGFLLFAPAMSSIRSNCTYIGAAATVTYENGAKVGTAFVTNLMGDLICTTAPELLRAVRQADDATQKQTKKQLRKLCFPDSVLRASTLQTMSRAGVSFSLHRGEGVVVSRACNDNEFGNSILLGTQATRKRQAAERMAAERMAAERMAAVRRAAEKAAAEKAAAVRLTLLPQSLETIARLDKAQQP